MRIWLFVRSPFYQKVRFVFLEISSVKWKNIFCNFPRKRGQLQDLHPKTFDFFPDISVQFDFHLGIFGEIVFIS